MTSAWLELACGHRVRGASGTDAADCARCGRRVPVSRAWPIPPLPIDPPDLCYPLTVTCGTCGGPVEHVTGSNPREFRGSAIVACRSRQCRRRYVVHVTLLEAGRA